MVIPVFVLGRLGLPIRRRPARSSRPTEPLQPLVLFIDHTAELGGAQLHLLNLAKEIRFQTRTLLLQDGPLARKLEEANRPTYVLHTGVELKGKMASLGAWRNLHKLIKMSRTLGREISRQQDVGSLIVVSNSLRASALLAVTMLPRGVNRVAFLHDDLRRGYLPTTQGVAMKILFRTRFSHVIVNSQSTAESYNGSRKRTSVVAPVMARGYFDMDDNRVACRDSIMGTKRILILGRLAPWKGQHVALEALQEYTRTTGKSGFELYFAGSALFGEEVYEAQLLEASCAMFQPGQVQFLGHVEDVGQLIDLCDLVVHTSVLPEPFGQVVVESMARRKVVLAANAGAPSEIIEDGVDGFLYSPGDPKDLAAKLSYVLDETASLDPIASRARLKALNFHPKIGTRRIEEVLLRVSEL